MWNKIPRLVAFIVTLFAGGLLLAPAVLRSQTNVANNAANLSGKTLLAAENSDTITGLLTFDRNPNPPFAVTSGSAKVSNLDADTLDGITSGRMVWTTVTTTSTGTQNDFDPGISGDNGPTLVIANNASNLVITGFPAGIDGQQILVVEENSSVQYEIASTGSTAGNRLSANVGSGTILTATFGTQLWVYSTVLDIWQLALWNGGSDFQIPYSAGDYTATGGGSFTVASGDLTRYWWEYLEQYEIHANLEIDNATISGTVSAANVELPHAAARAAKVPCMVHDNSTTTYVIGVGALTAASATMAISLASNWTASADNTDIYCNFTYKAQ